MRVVWSFWSKPHRAHYHRQWRSEKHHLLAWVLSVLLAHEHYHDTMLVTDGLGASLLVDGLGLPFEQVDLALDELTPVTTDLGWWVLGKLMAYARQTEPFLHLDADVFLWNHLPESVISAPVFAQNPEVFKFEDESIYRLAPFMNRIEAANGWLPIEWRWYGARGGNQAVCCGIVGGRRPDFLRHYAQRAIEVVLHPANLEVWPSLGVRDNILVEQYYLAACLAYHSHHSTFGDVWPAYLFSSSAAAFDPPTARRVGYTHLIGDAKRNVEVTDRLELRVMRDHPRHYERIMALLERGDEGNATQLNEAEGRAKA